jgi:hypothetical protein
VNYVYEQDRPSEDALLSETWDFAKWDVTFWIPFKEGAPRKIATMGILYACFKIQGGFIP